jgi:hypothetical protein
MTIACLVATAWSLQAGGPSDEQLVRDLATLEQPRILRLAKQALELRPPAITDHIAANSAGGPHDFFSQADYAWPNPTNRNGLPYISRDGQSNPDVFSYHRMAMRNMKDVVAALAASYALTGDDKYVPKAAELIRVFFLDEKTRMNPNLEHAQTVLGHDTGNCYGVIDTLHLAELAVAVPFLEKSHAFPEAVDHGLKKWFSDYITWMKTSTNGLKEMNMANNHSIAYFVQMASFARFTGNQTMLQVSRDQFKEVLLPRQMGSDGSFALELKRTKPYGYSLFQADNVATLCVLLSTPKEDLWRWKSGSSGETPNAAVDFIYPYLADKGKWLADGRGKDVMHWEDWPVRQPCLLFAYAAFGERKYFELWQKLEADPVDLEVRRNMAVTQPLLWLANPDQIPLLKLEGSKP